MGKSALIVVDLQCDFLPGGALAVAEGDACVTVANKVMASGNYDLVVFTKDWHPATHGSFASVAGVPLFSTFKLNGLDQVAWPDHCVQESRGAEFASELNCFPANAPIVYAIHKGTSPEVDSYSAFFDNARRGDTGLHQYLQRYGVKFVDVLGLATDYCVKYTALDAASLGYEVGVYPEGCRAVGGPAAQAKALAEMEEAGIEIIL